MRILDEARQSLRGKNKQQEVGGCDEEVETDEVVVDENAVVNGGKDRVCPEEEGGDVEEAALLGVPWSKETDSRRDGEEEGERGEEGGGEESNGRCSDIREGRHP